MNGKWLLPLLIITAIAPFAIYFYNNGLGQSLTEYQQPPVATIQFQQPNFEQNMEPGAQFGITSMQILDGYKFTLQLDNGQWIEAHLSTATKEEATPTVIEMFKTGSQPSVILYRKVENYWIVDINLNFQEERRSLTYLLRRSLLLY